MRRAPALLSLLLVGCGSAVVAPNRVSPASSVISPAEASAVASAVPGTSPSSPAVIATPTPSVTAAPGASPAATPVAAPAALPTLTGTAVLHIGDSFAAAGFAQALRPRMTALGVRYDVHAETSSYTTTWAGRMELLVANAQPDLVIVNLGANEFNNTDPPAHASAVRRIVKAIGARPCVWVSPPSWRKDTGILAVMRENSAPCRFFDSDALVTKPIARQKDKIHPNEAGGATWAEAFWSWLNDQRGSPDGGAGARNPWSLKPAPPEEHRARPAL